jgi:hypothetical protein
MEPEAHREGTCGVGLAGDGPAASTDTCGETANGGGDSGHLGPISSRGRKRAARGTCRAHRGSSGRRRTAAGGNGHGGGYARAQRRRVEGEGAHGEGKGRGRERDVGRGSYPLVGVGRWHASLWGSSDGEQATVLLPAGGRR